MEELGPVARSPVGRAGGRGQLCLFPVTPPSTCYNFGMAAIVGVHGIAQRFRGGYRLGSLWYDALRDGFAAAGYRSTADALAPADLRVAFFGNLFRPPEVMATQEPPFSAADVHPSLERDLLVEFYQAAVGREVSLGVPKGAVGGSKASVQVMLERLLRSRTFAGVAQRTLIGNLKQVTRFLTDNSVKDLVLARIVRSKRQHPSGNRPFSRIGGGLRIFVPISASISRVASDAGVPAGYSQPGLPPTDARSHQ